MRSRSLAWCLPLLMSSSVAVHGEQAGDPDAGRQLAEASCLSCHGSVAAPRQAPSFATIAAMPSTNARSLGVFLRTSHPAMPNLVLSASERDNVIAYILTLR